MRNTIAITESKNSEKVVKFVKGVSMLEEFTSHRTAIKICKAADSGRLYGCYLTKTGKLKSIYNW